MDIRSTFVAARHGTAQLAHFHEDMGDVVMALAKETRRAHAVELARRRRWVQDALGINGLKMVEPCWTING